MKKSRTITDIIADLNRYQDQLHDAVIEHVPREEVEIKETANEWLPGCICELEEMVEKAETDNPVAYLAGYQAGLAAQNISGGAA